MLAFSPCGLVHCPGKLLWESTAYAGRVYDDRHRKGSYASNTPVTDGKYVYAYFEAEGLYCYDFNGKLLIRGDKHLYCIAARNKTAQGAAP